METSPLMLALLTVNILYLMGYKLSRYNNKKPILSWANPIESPRTVYLFIIHLFKV